MTGSIGSSGSYRTLDSIVVDTSESFILILLLRKAFNMLFGEDIYTIVMLIIAYLISTMV